MAIRNLRNEELGGLVDQLTLCVRLLDLTGRRALVRRLGSLGPAIPEAPDANTHLMSILRMCALSPGGMEDLVNALIEEPDADPFIAGLDKFFQQRVSWTDAAALKRILPAEVAIDFTEEKLAAAYRRSIGSITASVEIRQGSNPLHIYIDDLSARPDRAGMILLLVFLGQVKSDLNAAVRRAVESWMKRFATAEGTTPARAGKLLPQPSAAEAVPYLMIEVAPGAGKDRYLVGGTLFWEKYITLEIDAKDTVSKEELPSAIEAYRAAALRRIAPTPSDRLMLEVFLPNGLLGCDLDLWLARVGASIQRPVGTHHAVVVRPQTRISDVEFLTYASGTWLDRWKRRPGTLGNENLYSAETTQQLDSLYDKLGRDVVVFLAFMRLGQEMNTECEEALKALIDSGTPVALWPRCVCMDQPEDASDVNGLLCSQLFDSIPAGVRDKRQGAHLNSAGARPMWKDIVLFWDDPTRVPPASPAAQFLTGTSE